MLRFSFLISNYNKLTIYKINFNNMFGFSSISQSYLKLLIAIITLKMAVMIIAILNMGIGLGPDEAQYWTWSRALDWGYYSKPPAIAWQIWLGTQMFGNTELGVRFLAVLISFTQSIAMYILATQSGLRPSTAFWCGMLMAFCPFGILSSLLAITDGGFILFWILTCAVMASALTKKKEANPVRVGVFILVGALFKWPIYVLWIFFFFCRWLYFPQQPLKQSLMGVGLSLVGLFPAIWWNYSHEWATFRHVLATLQGGHAPSGHGGNFLEFIGSQIALVSPILFVLLILAIGVWLRQFRSLSPALLFCGFVFASSMLSFLLASIFQKIQGNWSIFAYPTGLVVLGWYACEWLPQRVVWLKKGLILSITLTLFLGALAFSSFLPYRMNPFKHNMGWMNLKIALIQQGYNPQYDFLVSDKYQTTSLMSFYSEGQKRAYFLNLQGMRKNQFSYWPSLQQEQKGKIGYFVWVENAPHWQRNWNQKALAYQKELENYFERIDYLGAIPLLYQGEEVAKGALIFKCYNCLDYQLQESSLY